MLLTMASSLFCAVFLPLFVDRQFQCNAKPSTLLHNAHVSSLSSSSALRAKRDFVPSSTNCGCLSKYAPVNCRCTTASGNSDELLCRCDRALVSSAAAAAVANREDSIGSNRGGGGAAMATTQCGGNCNRMPGGEPNQRLQQQQQQGYGAGGGPYSYGGGQMPPTIHSACHPICHKSCTSSCASSRATIVDQNNFGGGFGELQQHTPQHNQPLTMDTAGSSNKAAASSSGCFPSQCRANCLRACARIFEGQQRQQQQIGENYGTTNGIDTNDVVVDPHYQVETAAKPYPDYGNNNNMMIVGGGGRNGGTNGCQCSPSTANICECQESCYPICIDTCESNCIQQQQQQQQQMQQQQQQTPAGQRAQCAQFCHLECQHDCAVGQQQQQQQRVPARKAVAETMENGVNNNNYNWPSAFNNNNGGMSSSGNPIASCAKKCPRACEQACQSAQNGEPTTNCVPACIGLCAQSCARGIQFDAVGLTQQMAMPMPSMAVDITGSATAQTGQNISSANVEEFEQQQRQMLNDWGAGGESGTQILPNFGQSDGPPPEMGQQMMGNDAGVLMPSTTPFSVVMPQATEEDSRQVQEAVQPLSGTTVPEMGGGRPCAPLCQPECRPECTKRYMEGNGMDRSENNGKSGGGTAAEDGQHPTGTTDQSLNDQQSVIKHQRSASSPAAFFPPHIILDEALIAPTAYDDDNEDHESNVTTKEDHESNVTTKGGQPSKKKGINHHHQQQQQLDKLSSWLRPQNETFGWDKRNGIELNQQQQQQNRTKADDKERLQKQQQKSIKDQLAQGQQKMPTNLVTEGKRRVLLQHHQHHQHQHNHHLVGNKDGGGAKIGRRPSEFFRRRKLNLFAGRQSKVPSMTTTTTKKVPSMTMTTMKKVPSMTMMTTKKVPSMTMTTSKKVPKNRQEEKIEPSPLQSKKRELKKNKKGGDNDDGTKAQSSNDKKWH